MTATPATRGVELWLVDLTRAADDLRSAEASTPRLSVGDRERLAAIASPIVRAEREVSWIALRLVLARVAGDGRYDGVPLQRSSTGKPFISDAPLSFSLSHSGGFALIAAAASPSFALGIDIQAHAPLRMSDDRAARLIAAGERLANAAAELRRDAAEGRDVAALRAFVRIEAVAKATGLGLAHVLARLGVLAASAASDGAAGSADGRFADALAELDIRDIAMPAGLPVPCHAAVAATRGALPSHLQLRHLPDQIAMLPI
ncbi:MAG: 4'-phosphopantetheinyl transferase family protein [Hyphomicrobiaceae bacterium]